MKGDSMRINLTQHIAGEDQFCTEPKDKKLVQAMLTFNDIPSPQDIIKSARNLAAIASDEGATEAMIGGAPFLMPRLERELRSLGILPLYAFSKREAVEDPKTGVKTSVFKHVGFIPGMI